MEQVEGNAILFGTEREPVFSDKLCYFFPQTFTGLTQRSFQPITPWKTILPLTEAFPAILIPIYFFKFFQSLWRSLTLFLILIFMLYPPELSSCFEPHKFFPGCSIPHRQHRSCPGCRDRVQSRAFPAQSLCSPSGLASKS